MSYEGLLGPKGKPKPPITRGEMLVRLCGTVALTVALVVGVLLSITDPSSQRFEDEGGIVRSWFNMYGSYGCPLTGFHQPSKEQELASLIRSASRMREHLKVVGSGASRAAMVCQSHDLAVQLVSLDQYSRVLSVDRSSLRATVQAGITLRQLSERLLESGLALPTLPHIDTLTISEAISVGAHGSSVKFGSISALVVRLTLIDSKGRVVVASKDENP